MPTVSTVIQRIRAQKPQLFKIITLDIFAHFLPFSPDAKKPDRGSIGTVLQGSIELVRSVARKPLLGQQSGRLRGYSTPERQMEPGWPFVCFPAYRQSRMIIISTTGGTKSANSYIR